MPITKPEITGNKFSSQYQSEEISSSDKRRLIKYILVDNQLKSNPDYDPEFYKQYQERSQEIGSLNKKKCLKEEAERVVNGGRSVILERMAAQAEEGSIVPPRPHSREEALKQSERYIKEYRSVSGRLRNRKLIDKYVKSNLAFASLPWQESNLARENSRKKHKARALNTPLYVSNNLSEEDVLNHLGDLRNKRGKNRFVANSAHALITELFLIGSRGKFLQVGVKHLAKRLKSCPRQINRAMAYLEKLGLIVRHGAHMCTNIFQISIHFSSSIVKQTLAAFAVGIQWGLLRDVARKAYEDLKASSYINILSNIINKKDHQGSNFHDQHTVEGQICGNL